MKKLVSIFLLIVALTFGLITNVGAIGDSYIEETDYMRLIVISIRSRDFDDAEYYTSLRNQKIIAMDLQNTYQTFSWDDAFCLMCAVYQEAGAGDYISDNELMAQALCVINRMNDERFANSIRGVLEQKGQYANFMHRGVNLVYRGDTDLELKAIERSFYIGLRVLGGEKAVNDQGEICPDNMIWASRGRQGTSTWWHTKSGTYFCCS